MDYQGLAKMFDERTAVNGADYQTTVKEVKALLEAKGAEIDVDSRGDWMKLVIFISDEEWLVRISASGCEISQISNMIM